MWSDVEFARVSEGVKSRKFEGQLVMPKHRGNSVLRVGRTSAKLPAPRFKFTSWQFHIINRSNFVQLEHLNGTTEKFYGQESNSSNIGHETCRIDADAGSTLANLRRKSNAISIARLIFNSTLLVIIIQSTVPPTQPKPCKSETSQLSQFIAQAASLNSSSLFSDADDFATEHEAAHLMRGRAEETPQISDGGGSRQSGGVKSNSREDLNEFLEGLPISSVGQKHAALFECNPNRTMTKDSKLVWVKLIRNASSQLDDITPLSIDERTITRDKRFKVVHQPTNSKWALTIDNIGPGDDDAFYLCQVGGSGSTTPGLSFVGGARLKVLVPPRIVDDETSPNSVQSDEFSSLRLACKVISEPQSQVSWRREDGKNLDGLEQRFRHHLERPAPHQVVSVDSAELLFKSIQREQAGAYLCIASNGVQPGVSQRISVTVVNCRQSGDPKARLEPCGQSEATEMARGGQEISTTTSTSTTTTTMMMATITSRQSAPRRANMWVSSGRGAVSNSTAATDRQATRRMQSQLDKSRGSRYNNQSNRRTNQAGGQHRTQEESDARTVPVSSGAAAGAPPMGSFEFAASPLILLVLTMARRTQGQRGRVVWPDGVG